MKIMNLFINLIFTLTIKTSTTLIKIEDCFQNMSNPQLLSQQPSIVLCLSISIGTLGYSYVSVVATQIGSILANKNNLSTSEFVWQLTLIVCSFRLGSIAGCLLYQHFVAKFGRLSMRHILLFCDYVAICAVGGLLWQLQGVKLRIFVFIIGLLDGNSASVVPKYIRTMAPIQISGKMGTFNQFMQTSAVLLTCLTGFLLVNINSQDQIMWRICLGFPLFPLLARILLLQYYCPYDQRNIPKLKEYLSLTYKDIQIPLKNILSVCSETPGSSDKLIKPNLRLCSVSRTYGHRLKIGMLLMLSNQATGINSIILYLKQLTYKILPENSQHLYFPQLLMTLIAVTQILATMLATKSVEKQGRRTLLIYGQFFIICILLSVFFVSFFSREWVTWITFALIFMHIVVHNWGLGATAIVYSADILDDLAPLIIVLRMCSFTVALCSDYMIEYIGVSYLFLIFALVSAFLHIFLRKWIIQTKNLEKAQIYELFDKNTKRD